MSGAALQSLSRQTEVAELGPDRGKPEQEHMHLSLFTLVAQASQAAHAL